MMPTDFENPPASLGVVATESVPTILSDEDKAAIRAEYLEERKALVESEQKYAESFDKIALTILSGALALSVGFIKDIAPHPSSASTVLLVMGWVILVAGVLGSMLGLYWAQQSFRRQTCIRDDEHRHDVGEETTLPDWRNAYRNKVDAANRFVIVSIFSGVLFVIAFTAWNFVGRALDDAKTTMKINPISRTTKTEPGASAPATGRPIPIVNTNKPKPSSGGDKKK